MTFIAPNLACGEARGGRIPGHGAVTDEQRSHRPNWAQPGARQVFFAQTSLLAPYRSTAGYARRSRLVWAKNPLPRTSSYLCLRPLRSDAAAQGDRLATIAWRVRSGDSWRTTCQPRPTAVSMFSGRSSI